MWLWKKKKDYQAVDVLKKILVGNDILVIDVRMPIFGDDVEDARRDDGRGKVGERGVAQHSLHLSWTSTNKLFKECTGSIVNNKTSWISNLFLSPFL